MKVIFNVNYNGVDGIEDLATGEKVCDACSQFYDEDGDFIGSEAEVTAVISAIVGDVDVVFNYTNS